MSLQPENGLLAEKHANAAPTYEPPTLGEHKGDGLFGIDPENMVEVSENRLHKDLKGRHMQMIAMQVQHTESSSVF
jgi:yeast amino acid transporter